MNVYVAGGASLVDSASVVETRLQAYVRSRDFDRPTLVIDTQRVRQQFRALARGLGSAHIHYAVKANPHEAVIGTLIEEGSGFDCASRGEIELCLGLGASPKNISYGNTIKRARDIAYAYENGIRLFAADAEEELEKIAVNAPGSDVYIRVLVMSNEADWPLSRKFGCAPEKALQLMGFAVRLGLNPVGISFHVGSQTREARMWESTLNTVADLWHDAREAGHALKLLNIGGGFPADYGQGGEKPEAYARQVVKMIADRFGDVPHLMAEPGRGMVGEAGVIAAEVLLVSKKSNDDLLRWVYLDIGRFSGLAETEG
ncbi:MAG TPA: type III PLP-dependent enzyme, partial [Paracoccaceae bacterium]|nr:type III PLP-dependent enzyme [Paracoccaceae bacterium]